MDDFDQEAIRRLPEDARDVLEFWQFVSRKDSGLEGKK